MGRGDGRREVRPLPHANAREVPQIFVRALKEWVRDRDPVEILDAGCGQGWGLDLTGIPTRITGVDADADAVRLRQERRGDLDEAIVADLLTAELPTGRFDVVHNAFVLEHVPGAATLLDRFFEWLRPGGLLLLRIPDRDSAFGFLSRVTPFWVHVLYRRYVFRQPTAGKPGYPPYRTFYDRVVSARGVREYCSAHGHEIVHEFGVPIHMERFGKVGPLFNATLRLVNLLSLGRLSSSHTNLAFVIRKSG